MLGIDIYWIGAFMGFVLGWIIYAVLTKVLPKYDGVIFVDDSDEEKTRWTLQYNRDPSDIPTKKKVVFRVHIEK